MKRREKSPTDDPQMNHTFPRPQWAPIVPADAVDGAAELAAGLTVEFRLRRHEGPRPVGDRAAARTEGEGGGATGDWRRRPRGTPELFADN